MIEFKIVIEEIKDGPIDCRLDTDGGRKCSNNSAHSPGSTTLTSLKNMSNFASRKWVSCPSALW
jgi:hypothetical protein